MSFSNFNTDLLEFSVFNFFNFVSAPLTHLPFPGPPIRDRAVSGVGRLPERGRVPGAGEDERRLHRAAAAGPHPARGGARGGRRALGGRNGRQHRRFGLSTHFRSFALQLLHLFLGLLPAAPEPDTECGGRESGAGLAERQCGCGGRCSGRCSRRPAPKCSAPEFSASAATVVQPFGGSGRCGRSRHPAPAQRRPPEQPPTTSAAPAGAP